jgi:hypothetical protein
VCQGIAHDVDDVVVAEEVRDLATPAAGPHELFGLQHTEVLGDEWLRESEGVDQVVHAALAVSELEHDGDAVRVGQRPQQLGRRRVLRRVDACVLDGLSAGGHPLTLIHAHTCIAVGGIATNTRTRVV